MSLRLAWGNTCSSRWGEVQAFAIRAFSGLGCHFSALPKWPPKTVAGNPLAPGLQAKAAPNLKLTT